MDKESHSSTTNGGGYYDSDEFKCIASHEYRKILNDRCGKHELTASESKKLIIAIVVFSLIVWSVTNHIGTGIGCAIFAFIVYGGSLVHTLPEVIHTNDLPSEKCKSGFFHGVLATVIFFMLLWMLVSHTNSQRKCHPNCRWCEEAIDEYNEESSQEHFDPRF